MVDQSIVEFRVSTYLDAHLDDVLLDIFHWRNLVVGSPRRLNLQLDCAPEALAKDRLDFWQVLPLII